MEVDAEEAVTPPVDMLSVICVDVKSCRTTWLVVLVCSVLVCPPGRRLRGRPTHCLRHPINHLSEALNLLVQALNRDRQISLAFHGKGNVILKFIELIHSGLNSG